MGVGIITGGGTDGQYSVSLLFATGNIASELASNNARISKINELLADEENETEIRALKAQLLSLQARNNMISSISTNEGVSAWCADLTETLTGQVTTIEVPGESEYFNIAPGHPNGMTPLPAGKLFKTAAMSPAQAFYNIAVLPGWQKWYPTYRYGTIDSITGDTVSVTLASAQSSQQSLNVNQGTSLSDVRVVYMTCNKGAFEEGDEVLVGFGDQDFTRPVVIGFKSNPKPCPECPSCKTIHEIDEADRCIEPGGTIDIVMDGVLETETCEEAALALSDGDHGGTFDNPRYNAEEEEWTVTYTASASLCDDYVTCPEICGYEFYCCLAWADEEDLPETISRNDLEGLTVRNGKGPYTWTITGAGFSLDYDETAGKGNIVRTDNTACGSGTVTVTDSCGKTISHTIRCTYGQWGAWVSDTCGAPGVGTLSYVWNDDLMAFTRTSGGFQTEQRINRVGSISYSGKTPESCQAAKDAKVAEYQNAWTGLAYCHPIWGGGACLTPVCQGLCATETLEISRNCVYYAPYDRYEGTLRIWCAYAVTTREWIC